MVYTMEEDFGIFVVYTMEGNFKSSWCTPWKLKMVLMVYTMKEVFGIFVVYTMEGNFRNLWCTPWKLKI